MTAARALRATPLLLTALLPDCRGGAPPRSEPTPIAVSSPTSSTATTERSPRVRSTPGAIVCGAESCDLATQVCCADGLGNGRRCAPRPKDDATYPCRDDELMKLCDENADCSAGTLCCLSWPCTGGCPPRYECEATRCSSEVGEICLRGGRCSAGFECHAEDGREQGSCFLESPGTDCGKARCSGATPVCRWTEESHSGQCVSPSDGADSVEPEPGVVRLRCTTASDCNGYTCGKMADSPFQVFHCAGPSLAGDRFWPILCGDVRDCPSHWGKAATGCSAPTEEEAPSFVKRCVYPE